MTEITEYISNDFKAIDSHDTISDVQTFFEDMHFSHFPIMEGGIYIGSIAAEDIETFDFDKLIVSILHVIHSIKSNILNLEEDSCVKYGIPCVK